MLQRDDSEAANDHGEKPLYFFSAAVGTQRVQIPDTNRRQRSKKLIRTIRSGVGMQIYDHEPDVEDLLARSHWATNRLSA